MDINNYKEYERVMWLYIAEPLLRYISRHAVAKLNEELKSAEISTRTLRQYATYEVNTKDLSSTIFINYEEIQAREARPPTKFAWGRFTSLDSSTRYPEGGMPIAYHMIDWLEHGSHGKYGNQPIYKVGMFAKTEQYLKNDLNKLVNEFLGTISIPK